MSLLSFIVDAKDQASAVFAKVKASAAGLGSGLGKVGNPFAGLGDKMGGVFSGMADKAKGAMASIKSAFSGTGGEIAKGLGAAAIAAFGKSILDYVGRIKDASEATGIGVERFQALAMVAKTNGVGMEQLSGSLERLRKVQGEIGTDQAAQATFKRLGMSIKEVQNADAESLLERLAQGITKTGDSAAAFDIFGKSAAGLLTTLKELEAGWDPLVAKMKAGLISEADIERLDQMGDSLDTGGTMLKVWGAKAIGATADIAAFFGKLTMGENPLEAIENVGKDNTDASAARKKAKQEAAEIKRAADAEARRIADTDAANKEGADLSKQLKRAGQSDSDYQAELQARVESLSAKANEEGLTELEQRKRYNEALKATLELKGLEIAAAEKVKAAEAKASTERRDEANTQSKAKAERLIAQSQYKNESARAKMTPEERLAQTEKNIANWTKIAKGETNEVKKKEATDRLIEQMRSRDEIKVEITDRDKERQGKEKSLMERDRELLEAKMTPDERTSASKRRQAELEDGLKKETNPDKRLELKSQILDEKEKQASLQKEKTARGMSIGDVFEKGYGAKGSKKDPVHEQVDLTKQVRDLLKKIEAKPGGMAP